MRFLATALCTAALTLFTLNAKAEQPTGLLHGDYFILEGGGNFTSPTTTYNAFISADQRAFLHTGWAISMAGGYKWSNKIRTELEFSYHQSNFKYFDTPANPYSGSQDTASVMANVIYDIPTGSRFTPYIGGGVGGTMAWLKKISQKAFGFYQFLNADSTRFAYQGIAGVAIAIAPQWEGLVDFRYRASDGHEFKVLNVLGTFNSRTDYNIHEKIVMAGFRYAF